jgi:hypothetical protein
MNKQRSKKDKLEFNKENNFSYVILNQDKYYFDLTFEKYFNESDRQTKPTKKYKKNFKGNII